MNGFECLDCGIDTGDSLEYYMLKDKVWDKANPNYHGMLCIGCVETRLGRVLTKKDFSFAPINNINVWAKSDRLLDRLGYGHLSKL